jgi:hypothetical protein
MFVYSTVAAPAGRPQEVGFTYAVRPNFLGLTPVTVYIMVHMLLFNIPHDDIVQGVANGACLTHRPVQSRVTRGCVQSARTDSAMYCALVNHITPQTPS